MSVFSDRILESLFINVTFNAKKFTIGSLYRPGTPHPLLNPREQFTQFCDTLSLLSEAVNNTNNPVYILGDTNFDVLKYNSCSNVTEYIDLLFSFGLLQVVTKPTRCTLTSATAIDHIICKSPVNVYKSIILTSKLSDHFPILHFLQTQKTLSKPKVVNSRNYSAENISLFNNSLSALRWNDVLQNNDAQHAYNQFSDNFLMLHDIHFPVITKKFNCNLHKIEKWMTTWILVSRGTKILMEKNHFCNPTPYSLILLKQFRNLYNKIVRNAKKLYFESELRANQSNLKKS